MTQLDNPTRHFCEIQDLRLSYVERHAELRGQGPTLFFAHATGFHARIWDQVHAALPAVHSVCVDLRGHGESEGGEIAHWNVLGQDLAALIVELGLRDLVCVGHSVGGHAMTQAAADLPGQLRALVLIDPVIMPRMLYAHADRFFPKGAQHPSSQRKRDFASVGEMIERFKDRIPYALFTPEVMQDYCTHALVPDPKTGKLTLACAPETESSTYLASLTNVGIYDCPERIRCPVTIVRAKPSDFSSTMDFVSSPTWPDLVTLFDDATDISRPDLSHFMPMQAPEFVAQVVATAAGIGFGD